MGNAVAQLVEALHYMLKPAFIPSYYIITTALAQIYEAEKLVKNFPRFYEPLSSSQMPAKDTFSQTIPVHSLCYYYYYYYYLLTYLLTYLLHGAESFLRR